MLNAAHRGYNYQDLLVAIRLVDVLLGTVEATKVDEKLVSDDRFDDLTTLDVIGGTRTRSQFKHRDDSTVSLPLATFTTQSRDLRLDDLVRCAIADRDGPGVSAPNVLFRILLRDARPSDPVLRRVLVPAAPDPGPFVDGMKSLRLTFAPDELWPVSLPSSGVGTAGHAFAFLQDGRLRREELLWLCERLIIEVECPAASFELVRPGAAEALLLERVRKDVGAEAYPNKHRSAVDVAQALIAAAQAYRQHTASASVVDLIRRTQLRQDFGAVARAHPVDASSEIQRATAVAEIVRAATQAAEAGRPLLVVGPPGQGKSWACHQVTADLSASGWLIADHYCFLGESDTHRSERVLGEVVFGSLLKQLADTYPGLVAEQRPRFAADERALSDALKRAREIRADQKIALIVDGLDHVTRVIGVTAGRTDPSLAVAEELSGLNLPQGCVLVVLSQPGPHLAPLQEGAEVISLQGFGRGELQELAERVGALELASRPDGSEPDRRVTEQRDRFVDALEQRCAGNALYATYLCREVVRHPLGSVDPAALLESLPPFDGTLRNYYAHLVNGLSDGADWVAEILGLLDFAVTRAELREMRPELGHRLEVALERLSPVLVQRAAQGGVRIYHESFARFLRERFDKDPAAAIALLLGVAQWLNQRDLFSDARAFRYLLPTLARAGREAEVLQLIGPDFAARAVAGGFMSAAIRSNLAVGAECAARLKDWASLARLVEVARAAESYEYERLESRLVPFADVPMSLLSPEQFAGRLLFDRDTTVPARAGLQLCATVDEAGAVAPWVEYLEAFEREREDDNTMYGEASDQAVALSILRGRLRIANKDQISSAGHGGARSAPSRGNSPTRGIKLERVAEWVEERGLAAAPVINALIDTLGDGATGDFISLLKHPGAFALAYSQRLALRVGDAYAEAAKVWALRSVDDGVPPGTVHEVLRLGVPVDRIPGPSCADRRTQLLALTRSVLEERVQFEPDSVLRWLDACSVAARSDSLGLATAEALLEGEGWYRCWLRSVIGLCRAEATDASERSSAAIAALQVLEADLRPFVGKPRACDLYRLRGEIASTLKRGLALIEDRHWPEAVRTVRAVADGTAVTLSGEMSGPVPFDVLLELIIGGTTPARREVSTAAIEEIQSGRAGGRYYADVAGFRLAAAQFALSCGDHERAAAQWRSACELLVGYGMHKDITIWDLLDPLPMLVEKDPARARECIAVVQPLCDRVWGHTDGKDTRHALGKVWEILAAADPMALSRVVAPALLASCNMPRWRLEDARSDLWLQQHHRVEPFLAGVLRYTLSAGLYEEDAGALSRLAEWVRSTGSVAGAHLVTLLLARADERPTEYVYTNSDDLLGKDDEQVALLNTVAKGMHAPQVRGRSKKARSAEPSEMDVPSVAERLSESCLDDFGRGRGSLARALRAWHQRPLDKERPYWSPTRFANAIGYRLLEAVQEGRVDEAMFALRTLADSVGFGDGGLLASIADGLDARGETGLAVMAHALAWTRSRGRGGWLTFGGLTSIESLRRAATLDSATTLSIVAEEVQAALLGVRGLAGITQALVYAFAGAEFAPEALGEVSSSLDVAFACWYQAAEVVRRRTPRLDEQDDPEFPYAAPAPDRPAFAKEEVERAFALATLAAVAHASREQKRRALVAMALLLDVAPDVAGEALAAVLDGVSDPLTLSWMLAVMRSAGRYQPEIARCCEQPLRKLCARPHLTVRALARELLHAGGLEPPPVPVGTADPHILASGSDRQIVLPEPDTEGTTPREATHAPTQPLSRRGERMTEGDVSEGVAMVAGSRLSRCESVMAGITDAVVARARPRMNEESHRTRVSRQLEAFSSRTRPRWPDAVMAPTECIEESLQLVGGDVRASQSASGHVVGDPELLESRLADKLLCDPRLALALEAVREPRPNLDPPPGQGAAVWTEVLSVRDGKEGPLGARADGGALSCTLHASPAADAPAVTEGRCAGWRLLGSAEHRLMRAGTLTPEDELLSGRYCGVELGGDEHELVRPPFGRADARAWFYAFPLHYLGEVLVPGPLVGIDDDGPAIGDSREGLGLGAKVLAPTVPLVRFLRLRPGEGALELADDAGPALRFISWRSDYINSDYELSRPLLTGGLVALRPDLFERLLAVGAEQIRWREVVFGEEALARR